MKKIKGEGFIDLETGEKGDLFIRFEFVLPPTMAEDTQESLKQLFPPIIEQIEDEPVATLKLEPMSDDEEYLEMTDSDDDTDTSDDDEESTDNEQIIETSD